MSCVVPVFHLKNHCGCHPFTCPCSAFGNRIIGHFGIANALLTGKLRAQRVIYPRAATCYTCSAPSILCPHPTNSGS